MNKTRYVVSPPAQAVYPHLSEPDAENHLFSVSLRMDPNDSKHMEFFDMLYFSKNTCKLDIPMVDELNFFKEPTGFKLVWFYSKYPPRLFDGFNEPLPRKNNIGHGSLIKVASLIASINARGEKIAMDFWVKAVQVLRLEEPVEYNAEEYHFTEYSCACRTPDRYDDLILDESEQYSGKRYFTNYDQSSEYWQAELSPREPTPRVKPRRCAAKGKSGQKGSFSTAPLR